MSWIFTESCHSKGPMDGVGVAIKNAIDDSVVAAGSIPNMSVKSANDIVSIINLVSVAISICENKVIENVKIILPQHLSISWKNIGISKVQKTFFSALCSNET